MTDRKELVVGQIVEINAAGRLGPSAIGTFIITGFTDEGIRGKPAFPQEREREGYTNQEIRFQPEDITLVGPAPS
jgi:hypothetical protein